MSIRRKAQEAYLLLEEQELDLQRYSNVPEFFNTAELVSFLESLSPAETKLELVRIFKMGMN